MIRYAVVGAGWISECAFLPAVAATGNSSVAAIVSGDKAKAARLAARYGVPETLDYAGYDALLASSRIDAVYIALPNDLHADYAIRALKAGKHALVEKPLAASLDQAEAMIRAAEEGGAFLMTAYRLHTEPGTIAALEAIRAGRIGRPVFFSSAFAFQAGADNHRLRAAHWGGPLQDVGVYCLNAARHVFQAEPIAVQAMEMRPEGDRRFAEIPAGLAVTLRFPGERLAQFFCSFAAETTKWLRVQGTEGELTLDPAFRFESAMGLRIRRGGAETVERFAHVDHFAGQIAHFSERILTGEPPQADGREGLADMRALVAIEQAARTGRVVDLPPMAFQGRIAPDMARAFPLQHAFGA